MMDLFIEGLTGTVFELKVSPFETIKSVKTKIQRAEGIPISQQHLIWQNNELEDDYSLRDYEISCGSTLRLVLGMRGGPINTRRVLLSSPSPVFSNCSTPSLRSACTSPQPSTGSGILNESSDHMSSNTHITLLVFKEGDQINLFRVVDKNDPTLSPVVEAIPDSPCMSEDNNDDNVNKSDKEDDETLHNSSDDEIEMRGLNLASVFEDHPSWLPDWLRFLPQPPIGSRRYPSIRFSSLSRAATSAIGTTAPVVTKPMKSELATDEEKRLREKCSNLQKKLEQLKLSKQSRQSRVSRIESRASSRQLHRNGQLTPLPNKTKVSETLAPVIKSPPVSTQKSELDRKQMDYPPLFPNGECNVGLRYSTRNATKAFAPYNIKQPAALPQINTETSAKHTDNPKRICGSGLCGRSSSLGPPKIKAHVEEISDSICQKRCFLCQKKTGLATSYECRCGNNFCSRHRYAETHQCTYDYKSEGRRWLQESNPMITASKLPKI